MKPSDPKHISADAVSVAETRPRKPYVAPSLKRLGSVRELSLAFSGGNQEGTAGHMKTSAM